MSEFEMEDKGENMAHVIQCFIGNPDIIQAIVSPLIPAEIHIAELPQGLHCLFLCEKLHDAIHRYQHTDNKNVQFLRKLSLRLSE